jgi:RIO kinase 1
LRYDDSSEPTERFSKRKDRRRPKGRRTVAELKTDTETARSSAHAFDDPGLQALYERGLLTDLREQLKSGKEATVYLADSPSGHLAAKIYSDLEVRSFKEDSQYRQGRSISGKRLKRALDQSSRMGLDPQLTLWVLHEYQMLHELHREGLPVPRPTIGPQLDDLVSAGRVVLMEFIGDDEGAAPRLADVRLDPDEATSAWQQSFELLIKLLELGKVHGDYSTYNLLWWEERVILIDLPQMVDLKRNRYARQLLERDVNSLCKSFRQHGIEKEPLLVLREVNERADLEPASGRRR